MTRFVGVRMVGFGALYVLVVCWVSLWLYYWLIWWYFQHFGLGSSRLFGGCFLGV